MINYTLLATLFMLIVVGTGDTELKVKGASDNGVGPKVTEIVNPNNSFNGKAGGSISDLDAKKVDSTSKGEDQVGGSTEVIQKSSLEKNNSSKQLESKEAQKEGTSTLENNDSDKKGEKKGKATEGSESKGKTNREILLPARKENFGGEECGLSDRCTAEKNALVACLRVPGNESLDLSLLIQNKGKGPLSVKISAPDFVWLEKTQIQLQENRNEQVKIAFRNGGTDSLIVLTAGGNGNCSLSFKDLMAHSLRKEADYTSQSTYIKFFNRTPVVAFIILAALLLLASIWTCLSFRWRHFPSNGSNYQKLDMELPISNGDKTDLELNAGWDDSWVTVGMMRRHRRPHPCLSLLASLPNVLRRDVLTRKVGKISLVHKE